MQNDKRLQTIARTFFSYLITDPAVRQEVEKLHKADDTGGFVRYVNALVDHPAPLQESELPQFVDLLQTINSETGAGIARAFEIEARKPIGVKHHKPPEP